MYHEYEKKNISTLFNLTKFKYFLLSSFHFELNYSFICYSFNNFRSTVGMSEENRRYIENQNPKTRMKKKSRRTRFGEEKQNVMRPHPVSNMHPDDLPQRARWTIIITAGLLLITCMLLVGVTLRMAPVIDELGKISLQNVL